METLTDRLAALFRAAELINENLWLDCIDSASMSVDDFAAHVEKTYDVEVEFYLLDVEVKHVYGFIERYGEGGRQVRIFLARQVGSRWMRLVGTKELCQVVLDKVADFSTAGEDTLERLVTKPMEIDADENRAYRSDVLAEYLAWELLYPHEMRKADLEKLAAGKLSPNDIAATYGMPLQIVELVLSRSYMDFAERWWARTLAEKKRPAAE